MFCVTEPYPRVFKNYFGYVERSSTKSACSILNFSPLTHQDVTVVLKT